VNAATWLRRLRRARIVGPMHSSSAPWPIPLEERALFFEEEAT
jgi:hypothetical protein